MAQVTVRNRLGQGIPTQVRLLNAEGLKLQGKTLMPKERILIDAEEVSQDMKDKAAAGIFDISEVS